MMEIKGKVHEISEVINVTDTFRKREIIVEYAENPAYPEYVKLEATQDRVTLFDRCKVGDYVEISFNLRGRPWTDKNGKTTYFNTLQVWRVSPVVEGPLEKTTSSFEHASGPIDISQDAEAADDLPF